MVHTLYVNQIRPRLEPRLEVWYYEYIKSLFDHSFINWSVTRPNQPNGRGGGVVIAQD
jgi:hypothetical protein